MSPLFSVSVYYYLYMEHICCYSKRFDMLIKYLVVCQECMGRGEGEGIDGQAIVSCTLSPMNMYMYMMYHTQIYTLLMTPPPPQVMAVMFEVQKWVWPHQLLSAAVIL